MIGQLDEVGSKSALDQFIFEVLREECKVDYIIRAPCAPYYYAVGSYKRQRVVARDFE